ncbi:hypothetical protein [Aequorivita capsosiphonis]|uniref:hypothetical protein n=1 Tax=Aequorivita capsosiphonis TaxID=487317 RepID=UPI0004240E81|nr:hypothetical protein [Aequorivita capsosiphonis]
MNYLLILFVAASLLSSCKDGEFNKIDKTEGILIDASNQNIMIDTINKEKLLKLSLEKAKNEYGIPLSEKTYLLNEAVLDEFRINLKNFYTDEQFKKPIPINEVTWLNNLKKDILVTVWYEKRDNVWKPFDILEYNKNAEF